MELVPVLDIMQGRLVRGVGGRRELYRPNVSCLTPGADPVETCQAIRKAFQPQWFYVADLDAIQTGAPPSLLVSALAECGTSLAVDAGVSTVAEAEAVLALGATRVIIGLESLTDLKMLEPLVDAIGTDRLIFSLDLRDGRPVGPAAANLHPMHVVDSVLRIGLHHLIVLEFTNIGSSRGVQTASFCHSVKDRRADVILWTGGGVRDVADLMRLQLNRLDGAMVASALHDGKITPNDWQSFQAMDSDAILQAIDA